MPERLARAFINIATLAGSDGVACWSGRRHLLWSGSLEPLLGFKADPRCDKSLTCVSMIPSTTKETDLVSIETGAATVPSLLNWAVTGLRFHDNKFSSIAAAVKPSAAEARSPYVNRAYLEQACWSQPPRAGWLSTGRTSSLHDALATSAPSGSGRT